MANKKDRDKLFVLSKIEEKKNLLFAKHSPTVTEKDKESAWRDILNECVAAGVDCLRNEKWEDLRDVTWQNWKRTAKVFLNLYIYILYFKSDIFQILYM